MAALFLMPYEVEPSGGPRVAVTILPLYVLTVNVAGPGARVTLLIPPGSDPHEFTLKPRDAMALREAELIIAMGGGLDEQVVDRVPGGVKTVFLADGLEGMRPGDPHAWLDPLMARAMAVSIAEALGRADPPRAEAYMGRARSYGQTMAALDREIQSSLGPLRGSYVITYHESFGYFARRYGLKYHSLTGPGAEQPLPGRIKEVYALAVRERIPAVFQEPQFPPEKMERIARDIGARVCTLDPMVSGRPGPTLYEDTTRANVRELLRCLQGGTGH